MSDIFDDVEKMIAAEGKSEDTPAMEPSAEESQSFNDSELEDIMAEIESLESDFSTDEEVKTAPAALAIDSSKIAKTSLQMQIESELENNANDAMKMSNTVEVETQVDEPMLAVVEEPVAELDHEEAAAFTAEELEEIENSTEDVVSTTSTILPFEVKSKNNLPMKSKSEMSFEASGSMNVVLKFKVGSETAELVVDQERGLVVSMNGVELCISEDAGCTVTMDNGTNFNIPLTTSQSSSKKKAA